MANFTGKLNSNEIFASLFNMIISQQVFADNLKGTYSSLVDSARVDGSMSGDTKLYYSTDILQSYEWGNDAEAENLLKLYRPKAPEVQAITLDIFRQIPLTVDNYLSKRAWGTESSFSDFNSVMLGWIRNTKKVYDSLTYNTFIGTTVGNQMDTIDVTAATKDLTGEAKNRVEAQTIAEYIAKLLTNMQDIGRDYNGYGFMRSYNKDELQFVWNADAIARIEKRDLPTIYNKDIMEKFGENILPGRYFGYTGTAAVIDEAGTHNPGNNVFTFNFNNDDTKLTVISYEDGVFAFSDITKFKYLPQGAQLKIVDATGNVPAGLENVIIDRVDENLGGIVCRGCDNYTGDGSGLYCIMPSNKEFRVIKECTPTLQIGKNNYTIHLFPGDSIYEAVKKLGYGLQGTFNNLYVKDVYLANDKVLFKVIHKGPASVPFMSAFEVATSFFNPKSLTETHYLTWGHNTLEYLKEFPFITVMEA